MVWDLMPWSFVSPHDLTGEANMSEEQDSEADKFRNCKVGASVENQINLDASHLGCKHEPVRITQSDIDESSVADSQLDSTLPSKRARRDSGYEQAKRARHDDKETATSRSNGSQRLNRKPTDKKTSNPIDSSNDDTRATLPAWVKAGAMVTVKSRTWPRMNRPGGTLRYFIP